MSRPAFRNRVLHCSSSALVLAIACLAALPALASAQAARATAAPAAEPPAPHHTIVVRPPATAPAPPQRAAPLHPVERIDLSLRDADLVEVLRTFAVLGGFNLVVDPGVEGTVTVELRDVEWPRALAAILRTHGLAAEIDGRIVAVRPLPGLPPR